MFGLSDGTEIMICDEEKFTGKILNVNLNIIGLLPIRLKIARVYDWYDQAFWIDGQGVIQNYVLEYKFTKNLERGLYILLCVRYGEEIVIGNENDNTHILGAFIVKGDSSKNPLDAYKFIRETRELKFNEPKGNYKIQGNTPFNVFVFAKNLYAQTTAQYCDVEIYPFDYLTMESEVNYINRFFKCFPGINIDVKKDKFDKSIPAAVFCIRNIYASSYEEAEEYALKRVEMLNSVYTVLLRSHGTFFATIVFNPTEQLSRINVLDTRYKGNLLLLAEQGFNIRHFYKHISTTKSYMQVYLKLLNEAINENNRMLQYYRYWNIVEGIASKKKYHLQTMKKWDGSIVKHKGRELLIENKALDIVFELYRENFGSISDADFVKEIEEISKSKEFLSVCYQRRNCCVHQGACYSTDSKVCDSSDRVKNLCKTSFIICKNEPLGHQDKILRKLQDTVCQIVLNELKRESGTVRQETDLVDIIIS